MLIAADLLFQHRRKSITLAGMLLGLTLVVLASSIAGVLIRRLWKDPNLVLTVAAAEGYDRILVWGVRHGGDVNGLPRTGMKALPLEIAITAGNRSTAELLLRLGADPNRLTSEGKPLALLAAGDGDEEILRALWQHGMNLNARSADGETAMQSAFRDHQWASIRFLVEHGADLNARDSSGGTALMMATCTDSPEATKLVDLLLRNGADITIKDNEGHTALDLARTCNDKKAIEILSH